MYPLIILKVSLRHFKQLKSCPEKMNEIFQTDFRSESKRAPKYKPSRRQNDVVLTSMRRDDVASTLIRRHFYVMCPLGSVPLFVKFQNRHIKIFFAKSFRRRRRGIDISVFINFFFFPTRKKFSTLICCCIVVLRPR